MLTFGDERRQIWLHRDKAGGITHKATFDLAEPMPWRAEVDLILCSDCFLGDAESRELTPADAAAIDAKIVAMQVKLIKSNNAWAIEQIAKGAATLTEAALLARAKGIFGSTRLNELRKAGMFPEPVIASGRNVWIESEAAEAIARVVARDTETAAKRRAPLNRYSQKSAAKR